MNRTQIYLDEEIKQELLTYAVLEKTSMAEVIRRFLKKQLEKEKKSLGNHGKEALLKLAERAKPLGKSNLAGSVDEYFEKTFR